MKYGIVVDSGCDLTSLREEVADKIDFTRSPLTLDIGDKEFIDSFDLDIEEFMKEMYSYKGKTGSAAPSPNEWLKAYEKSENVFAISITGTLSASYSSAVIGMELFKEKHPDRNIYVIDSKSTGPEMSLIVRKLTEYMKDDMSFEDICKNIDTYCKRTHLLFILESLENLVKNGRVSRLKASMAGILGIKMLGVASEEGTIDLLHKCRGKMAVYDKAISEMLERNYHGGRVIISHCFAHEVANYVVSKIKEKFPNCDVEIMKTSGLCSFYAEKGGLLIGFES